MAMIFCQMRGRARYPGKRDTSRSASVGAAPGRAKLCIKHPWECSLGYSVFMAFYWVVGDGWS
jgi:hypothetical protein